MRCKNTPVELNKRLISCICIMYDLEKCKQRQETENCLGDEAQDHLNI